MTKLQEKHKQAEDNIKGFSTVYLNKTTCATILRFILMFPKQKLPHPKHSDIVRGENSPNSTPDQHNYNLLWTGGNMYLNKAKAFTRQVLQMVQNAFHTFINTV